MPIVSIVFGLLLCGVSGYSFATSTKGWPHNATSLIPAAFGVVLLISGAVALVERFLKHAMHAAAAVGLIGLLVGVGGVISSGARGAFDLNSPATQGTLGMIALCLVFIALCINSFIQARRRRMNRPPVGPPA